MTEKKPRTFYQRHPRHSAEVTAIRLAEALQKWPDAFDGRDRDEASHIIHILNTIVDEAEEKR